MLLSRSTWHYKLYNYLWNVIDDGPKIPFRGSRTENQPKTLCRYFWFTTLMTVFVPLVGVILAAVALIVIALLPIWWFPLKRFKRIDAAWDEYKAGYGPKPVRNFAGFKTTKAQKSNLLIAFLKAYKQKHCPLITLVD